MITLSCNKKPKSAIELRGSTGRHREKRRPTTKTFCDIKFICTYIERKAEEEGMDVNDRGPTNVRLMYDKVAPVLFVNGGHRQTQFKWRTLTNGLRKRLKAPADAANPT